MCSDTGLGRYSLITSFERVVVTLDSYKKVYSEDENWRPRIFFLSAASRSVVGTASCGEAAASANFVLFCFHFLPHARCS